MKKISIQVNKKAKAQAIYHLCSQCSPHKLNLSNTFSQTPLIHNFNASSTRTVFNILHSIVFHQNLPVLEEDFFFYDGGSGNDLKQSDTKYAIALNVVYTLKSGNDMISRHIL